MNEKAEAAHDQAHDEQDLAAQQRAASSALATTILSFLALIATGLGLYYVRETLRATLKAVEDTGQATEAMREANRIAETSSRAWLTLEMEHGFYSDRTDRDEILFFANLKITNIGGTPAQNVTVETASVPDVIRNEFHDLVIISENLADQFSDLEHMVVFPNSTESFQAIFSVPVSTTGFGPVAFPDIMIIVNYRLGNGLAAQTSARFLAEHGDGHREIFQGQALPDDFRFARTGYIRVT
ncbi:hypothetical protein SZ64_12705 [Erythrobacter sp. SG61-1L]|nr:hypothetical protein SZ64_12705 [Erythrobacter sp. SG61-1L]